LLGTILVDSHDSHAERVSIIFTPLTIYAELFAYDKIYVSIHPDMADPEADLLILRSVVLTVILPVEVLLFDTLSSRGDDMVPVQDIPVMVSPVLSSPVIIMNQV
jgi:hypothetical protein